MYLQHENCQWIELGEGSLIYELCYVHLGLIGKHVVDFLSVLIELFSLGYGWGATSDYWLKIGDFVPTGSVDPKFHVEGVAPTSHSSSQNTRINVLSYGIKIGTDLSSILSGITRVTDGRTDGRTEFSSLDRVCISCSAVKMKWHYYKRKKLSLVVLWGVVYEGAEPFCSDIFVLWSFCYIASSSPSTTTTPN